MSDNDKMYIKFVESMDMFIPDGDCEDYRDQDDYRAICFMNKELTALKEQNKKLRECVEFYASNQWNSAKCKDGPVFHGEEKGGKMARKCLEEIERMG